MAPSCVPASPFESPRRPLTAGDLESLMRRRRVLGLAEMMNFPGVIDGLPGELEKLGARGRRARRRPRPGLLGKRLQAYAAAGIYSDHEALTVEEGRERLRAGHVAADPRGVDGAEPPRAAAARRGVRAGAHRVLHRRPRSGGHRRQRSHQRHGARGGRGRRRAGGRAADGLAPSRRCGTGSRATARSRPATSADLLAPPGPRELRARRRAQARAARSRTCRARRPRVGAPDGPDRARSTPADFAIPSERGPVRAIGLVDGSGRDRVGRARARRRRTVTRSRTPSATSRRSPSSSGTSRPGRVGLGFVAGSGLQRGALASSVAHDAHNLVVVGMTDEDMAFAVSSARRARRRHRRGRERRGRSPSARCRSPGCSPTRRSPT